MAYANNGKKGAEAMPRPQKCRRVCCMPKQRHFGPLDGNDNGEPLIVMTVDEFESIRLIDLEGLTQEECAKQMEVARTTAQAIYNSARIKLVECVIHCRKLHIAGGNYSLYGNHSGGCRCGYRSGKTHMKSKIQEDKK